MLNILDNFAADSLRNLFSILIAGIYKLIANMYNLIMDLANISVFSGDLINEIAIRIYTFIGIVMFFSLSVVLIQYLIDPEKISDKKMGGSAMVRKIFIAIIFIIITPSAFSLLYRAQSAIIEDHLIENVVLGEKTVGGEYSIDPVCYEHVDDRNIDIPEITDIGDFIALNTLSPFFQITNEETGNPDTQIAIARNTFIEENDYFVTYCEATTTTQLLGNPDIVISPRIGGGDDIVSGEYSIDFQMLLALIVGLLVLGLLATNGLDIATRSIKLGFLQIVAPVPILGYISPNEKQSEMFNKWLKEVFTTWFDLFIRLFALNIVVLILSILSDFENGVTIFGDYTRQSDSIVILKLFVLLGGLIFAKKLPSLIEQITGIKMDGGMLQFNPLKRIEKDAIGGDKIAKAVRSTPRAAVAAGMATYGFVKGNQFKQNEINKKNKDRDDAEHELNKSKIKLRQFQNQSKNLTANKNRYINSVGSKLFEAEAKKRAAANDIAGLNKMKQNKEQLVNTYGNKAYNRAVENVKAKEAKYQKTINDNQIDFDNKAKKALDTNKKISSEFSFKHRGLAGTIKVGRAIKSGYSKTDKKAFSGVFADAKSAATEAAKTQKAHDINTLKQRKDDYISDIAGVTDSSGTTSKVKGKIKGKKKELDNVRAMMHTLKTQINYNWYEIAEDGKKWIVSDYNFRSADERYQAVEAVKKYNSYHEREEALEKEIKELEETLKKEKK